MRTPLRPTVTGAVVATIVIVAAACAGDRRDALLVGAASDIATAMPHLAAAFEQETGIPVVATLGSSGQLAQQVIQGAPVDVLMSADRSWVERVAAAGRIAPDGRAVYARGRLVLVSAAHAATPFDSVAQLATARRVAIANPQHAPYGRAAREALQAAGVWDALGERVVIAENVRQALQFVRTGDVDATLTALSLMDADHGWSLVPETLHEPLVQEAGAIADRPMTSAALRFIAFLSGPRAREILRSHRFVLPADTAP